MSGALVIAAAAAAGGSSLVPSVLSGTDVAMGNMRGTAHPRAVLAMAAARGLVVWLGTLAYLLYQAVMFCFATPLNNLFLIYVAYLSLSVWSLVTLLRATDMRGFGARLSPRMPARPVAGFALTVVVLNAAAWLAQPSQPSSAPTQPQFLPAPGW